MAVFEKFVFNTQGQVRREKLEGKEYIVAPAVMGIEGVLDGSKGPLFYPKEEWSKTPAVWNHKPVVINHPTVNGEGISACDQKVLEEFKSGMLFNTAWEDGKLKTEVWLDEEKTKTLQHGPKILENIQNGVKMEVSTGLWTDNELTPGEYNGVKYNAVIRNIRPDHLAILPSGVGALPVSRGGGLLQNEGKDRENLVKYMRLLKSGGLAANSLTVNGLSFGDIQRQLNQKLDAGASSSSFSCCYVEDVYDSFYVYHDMADSRYYKQDYGVGEDLQVKTSGQPVEVRKHQEYRNTDGSTVAPRKVDLDTGGSGKPVAIMNQEKTVADNNNQTPPPAPPAQPVQAPVFNSVGEFVQNGVPQQFQGEIREALIVLNQKREQEKQEKAHYVAGILTNNSTLFTQEQLNAMDLNALKGVAQLAQVPAYGQAPAVKPPANYAGAGTPAPVNNSYNQNQQPTQHLIAPTINWSKN